MADVEIETIILQGVFASRPAAADALEYYATDTDARYWSDGATWFAQPAAVETHVHAGADITSGTVADARIASTIARDSEITATKLDDFAAPDDNTDLNATTGLHGLLPKLGGGTTNFLRADGSWNAPPGGSGATASENLLTGEVTMTNANQFYDGPSLSLPAGTYLFWGSVTIRITTAGVITMTARLLEGANVLDESAFTSPSGIGGGAETLHVQGMAVLGSTTTVKVSAAAATAGQVIDNTVPTNGTADKGSHLLALKIA